MTETSITQNAPILVAIDIAKARHEVLIAIPGKKRRRRLTILNQPDDFKRLTASLASYSLPVRGAFEATGNYHRAIAYHLAAAGFEMKWYLRCHWPAHAKPFITAGTRMIPRVPRLFCT